MDQFELELKRALERQDPGPDLAARVMSQVRSEPAIGDRPTAKVVAFSRVRRRVWRWAAVGAVAASLAVSVLVEQRRSDRRAATAEAELYETLLLAGEKLSQARDGVTGVSFQGVTE